MIRQFFPLLVLALAVPALSWTVNGQSTNHRHLLIVIDGLRPDYITPELMPNLHAMGEAGVFGEQHAAVFPTVTRVNSPSISTGSYPATHGLIHNTMYSPDMPNDGVFSTGSAGNLRRFDAITGGRLLTSVSVGEVLEEHERRLFVTGSGGTGNTLLQNHRGKGMGIWQSGGLFLPAEAREQAIEELGDLPESRPAATVWAFDSYLNKALSEDPPEVTIVWINEPDSAGHGHGVGAPETIAAIANVDEQIGRVLAAHEEHGLTGKVNIFLTTDHGFTTSTGRFSVAATLRDNGIEDDDLKVVSNMIYLERKDPELLARAVEALQRDEEIGTIYTRPARPGSSEGIVPGTLSMAAVQWDHDRSPDVLVSPSWNDDVNEFGFAGATTRSGTATHGSDSPYDVQIRLVATGPDIKNGLRSQVPSGNVDFIPTILHLVGIEPPEEMDGRILQELLQGGPEPETVLIHEHVHRAAVTYPDGFRYQTEIETRQVGSTFYLRGSRTTRTQK